jgi:hypothetical protein
MAIRLSSGVLDDERQVSPTLWQAQLILGLPVGRCDCGGYAYGEEITQQHGVGFATAVCTICQATAGARFTYRRPRAVDAAPRRNRKARNTRRHAYALAGENR